MQTNSENHETSKLVLISYVDVVVKNSKGFEHIVTCVDTNQEISTWNRIFDAPAIQNNVVRENLRKQKKLTKYTKKI